MNTVAKPMPSSGRPAGGQASPVADQAGRPGLRPPERHHGRTGPRLADETGGLYGRTAAPMVTEIHCRIAISFGSPLPGR
ncbi:hypothetical protein STXM2123_3662 [Streptomyces sp. F-3]|nr:hypothetical protein STXM2123_3662 [Streptomyces sp. F-3]